MTESGSTSAAPVFKEWVEFYCTNPKCMDSDPPFETSSLTVASEHIIETAYPYTPGPQHSHDIEVRYRKVLIT